ncbi:MAG: hypothetical protein ACP5D2_05360 [Candidatus Nanoarchaeia archaeon]
MVKTLEPLVEELPRMDLSEQEGFLAYQREQQEIKSEACYSSGTGCYSTGCYSPSSCIDCYSVD